MSQRRSGLVRAGFRRAGSPSATPAAGVTAVADWTIGIRRIYAIDPVLGNDANKGYADPASTSTAHYALACQAAGLVAKQTPAGLQAILPPSGAGRALEIVGAAGTYAAGLDFLSGLSGYASGFPKFRGTATNTTAGCVAFDGSQNDCIYQGGVTVTGLNAAGYNPDAATSAVLTLALVGGGVPAFPAEPAAPLGWRVRFDAATTTVAQRNKCYQVLAVTATTVQLDVSITRVAGDVLYLEQGGCVVPATTIAASIPGGANALSISGVRWTAGLALSGCRVQLGFCGGTTLTVSNPSATGPTAPTTLSVNLFSTATAGYSSPYGTVSVGGGWAGSGQMSVGAGGLVTGGGYIVGGVLSLSSPGVAGFTGSCVFGAGVTFNGSTSYDANNIFGNAVTSVAKQPNRIIGAVASRGGIDVEGGYFGISGNNVTNAGALPAIKVFGAGITFVMSSDKHGIVGGATGNNDVGLDLGGAFGCNIAWFLRPTVTGGLGDVRLGDGTITSWAALAAAGTTVDTHGNRLSGP